MTQIEIGSKWKYKDLPDVYTVIEATQHRVLMEHKMTGTRLKTNHGLFKRNYVPVEGEND